MTRHPSSRLLLQSSNLVSSIVLNTYRRDIRTRFHLNPSVQFLYLAVLSTTMLHRTNSISNKRDSSTLTKSIIPLQCQQDPPPLHRVFTRSRANLTTRIRGRSYTMLVIKRRNDVRWWQMWLFGYWLLLEVPVEI
jgi:hypothetical protein